jgi:metal-responsive CopG/Arc/MetJ family transcriptional regulator
MNVRKIGTSLPAAQYEALERTRKRLKIGRSEAVQRALALWLDACAGDERITRYIEGYARIPDDPREGRALAKAWAHGLEAEDW